MALFVLGFLGGAVVEALKYARKLQNGGKPKTGEFIASAIVAMVGGVVAAAYAGQNIESVLLAMQIGATAPAIVGAWVSGGPPKPESRWWTALSWR